VSILLNKGDGTFSPAADYPVGSNSFSRIGTNLSALAVGDPGCEPGAK
jgi:hypothetical protein